MNLKYILIVIVLATIIGGGTLAYQYWWLPKEEAKISEIKPPEVKTPEEKPSGPKKTMSPEKIDIPTETSEEGPLDTALAEIIVLSTQDEIVDIRIEKITDYNRYPGATYPQLEVDDEVTVRVYYLAPEDSGGLGTQVGQIKEGEPPSVIPQPKAIAGKEYLADMRLCFTGPFGVFGCKYEGWSVALYPL